MRAVHFRGAGRVEITEVPTPEPRGTEVLVRVKSASICGTDRENLMGAGQATIPGHENAGEVAAVDAATRVRTGDRVAVNCHVTCGACAHCRNGDLYFCEKLSVIGFDRDGGYAEYVLVPESSCMPIPDAISYEQASLMVDMLGTPFQAFRRAGLRVGEQIAIWGAGPIGMGLLMTAVQAGVRVAVIDLSEYRLKLARELQPEIVINPGMHDVGDKLQEWTDGRGVRTAFDCVGSEKVCLQALSNLAKRGTLVVVGVSHRLTINPWEHLICRELTILGTRNFNTGYFPEMARLIEGGLPVLKTVTHRFSLEKAGEAFSLFTSGECGKILIVEPLARP
ncbi:MAG: alcohol dehydrogenase catalytic domain-containing protein [Spirochaetia bacterium]|jgi:propanol-preferring alcohol dehydrogenase